MGFLWCSGFLPQSKDMQVSVFLATCQGCTPPFTQCQLGWAPSPHHPAQDSHLNNLYLYLYFSYSNTEYCILKTMWDSLKQHNNYTINESKKKQKNRQIIHYYTVISIPEEEPGFAILNQIVNHCINKSYFKNKIPLYFCRFRQQ